jgi:acyl transferase domain-containing protein/NAD(P)-dependent dehydrogenase (short-subunit alcohol dehydrogenase family)
VSRTWSESVAIVGIGCRFPGTRGAREFWASLRMGTDHVREVPPDRWDADALYDPDLLKPGSTNTKWGSFLEDPHGFDAPFFGVSPKEAESMDPQQRLLLEVSWEALEDAGIRPKTLAGTRTGVFVGQLGSEFSQARYRDPESINAYFVSGNAVCMLANRLSHFYRLSGESLSLDTGCSASLVATHLACEGLLFGELDLAIAGGVSLIFTPRGSVGLSQAWMTAADGRCKSFDASADGYVRGEGCGLVVLKRLSEALRDGDRIWAVLRGSAVNHGAGGETVTVPSAEAQEAVIRTALDRAGLGPEEIDYLEAHGVGTPAADLAEGKVISRVFGARRPFVGSVKGNIGHLEGAAGIAGLIKTVLAIDRAEIPAQIHFRTLHPELARLGDAFVVPTAHTAWPEEGRPRRAGVSSFGLGGSNAHLVVEAAPKAALREKRSEDRPHLLVLSARTPAALRRLIEAWVAWLDESQEEIEDLCLSALIGRTQHSVRAAVVGRTKEELRSKLLAWSPPENTLRISPRAGSPVLLSAQRKLELAAELFAQGFDLAVDDAARPHRRVELPSYPFDRPKARKVETAPTDALGTIKAELEQLLGTSEIDPDRGFFELGLTSLMAVELRNRLARRLGEAKLAVTSAFDHPTPRALAEHIAGRASKRASVDRSKPSEEPIAIIGMACRYPGGAYNAESYWKLLTSGVDCVREVPKDRWEIDRFYDANPEARGKMYTRSGTFLEGVAEFDPIFFGLSPREASAMDPQQRILLEVAWEAFENAGVTEPALAGSRTGVFVGLLGHDYMTAQMKGRDESLLDAYYGIGTLPSAAAGRISHALKLQGPAVVVDTACSSSLVAVHLACQSLRSGESSLAIAGGVNLMLTPDAHIALSRLRALSPDGRCKTFDARADGYGRGEGCGLIVLRRLSEALANGDPIIAVVRGSAVNHDGASSGFTVPNGEAQRAVIRSALASAGAEPKEVGYVEAHGTGTPLGDPIELSAIASVLGEERRDRLAVGSVKANLGHLESAAGIAGLMKAALAVERGLIPPQIHFESPSPHIRWSEIPIEIPVSPTEWRIEPKKRLAGVSSFGLSGTNAHLVLQGWPRPEEARSRAPEKHALLLSAKTEEALIRLIDRTADWLEAHEDIAFEDVCHTAAVHRTHFRVRTAIVARTGVEAAALLRSRPEIKVAGEVSSKEVRAETPEEMASLYLSGYIPRRSSSGRRVVLPNYPFERRRCWIDAETAPTTSPDGVVFLFPGHGAQSAAMGKELLSDPVFREAVAACDAAFSRLGGSSVIEALSSDSSLDRVEVIQPALFALGVGLVALWRSRGVVPEAVVGQSMGEVTAAWASGALELDQAAAIVHHRSRLLSRVEGQGAMLMIELSREETKAYLDPSLSIALSNGPRSTVVSGAPPAIDALRARLEAAKVFHRRVSSSIAFHSSEMDPLVPELRSALGDLRPRASAITQWSTITASKIAGGQLDAHYWARNLREPVELSSTIEALVREGFRRFVEISPQPVILPAIDPLIRGSVAVATLRRGRPARETFERAAALLREAPARPLLKAPVLCSIDDRMRFWECDLSSDSPRYVADHRLNGSVVVPASLYLELVATAAKEVFGGSAVTICEVVFKDALSFEEQERPAIQLSFVPEGADRFRWQVASRTGSSWRSHAEGAVHATQREPELAGELPTSIRVRCLSLLEGDEHFARLSRFGIEYGPSFRVIREIAWGGLEALGTLDLGDAILPLAIDAATQVLAATLPDDTRLGPLVPVSIDELFVRRSPVGRVFSHVRWRVDPVKTGRYEADVRVIDERGQVLVEISRVCGKRLPRAPGTADDRLLMLEWRASRVASEGGIEGPVSVVGEGALARKLEASLAEAGTRVIEELDLARHVVYIAGPRFDRTALELAQAATKSRARDLPRLWLVTRGAQDVPGRRTSAPHQAALIGFGRSLAREHPELQPTRIDLSPDRDLDRQVEVLIRELAGQDSEEEIAYAGEQRFVARLVRRPQSLASDRPATTALRSDTPLRDDEVELQIEQASSHGALFGRVASIGAAVRDLRVGDRVWAWTPETPPAAYARAHRSRIARVPEELDGPRSMTGVFAAAIAWYALRHIAEVNAGETVLLHALSPSTLHGAMLASRALSCSVTTEPSFAIARVALSEGDVQVAIGAATHVIRLRPPDRPIILSTLKRGTSFAIADFEAWIDRRAGRLEEIVAEVIRSIPERDLAIDAEPILSLSSSSGAQVIRSDATYLVTGGLGALGLALARSLAAKGARHLVLAGRSGESNRTDAISELRAMGVEVKVAAIDVADRDRLATLLEEIEELMPPLRGIVHAAGVLRDGPVANQTWGAFEAVFGPKIEGAFNLHELTERLRIDFFVLYSSAASMLGIPGQSNYAAANAFLDALARLRHAENKPAISVSWGLFKDVGLAAGGTKSERLIARGARPLHPEEANELFEPLVLCGRAHVGVVPIDVRQWIEFYPSVASSPMFSELVEALRHEREQRTDTAFVERLRTTSKEKRRELLADLARDQLARIVQLEPSEIALDQPLAIYGVSSLSGLELKNQLEAALGLRLSATLVFTHPTLAAIGVFLDESLFAPEAPGATSKEQDAVAEEVSKAQAEIDRASDEELAALGKALLEG